MAYFTDNFNQEFATYNQVYRLGGGESLTPAAGYTIEQFDDPFGGGFSYAALRQTGATTLPAAPQMVINARTYKQNWDAAEAAPSKTFQGQSVAVWEAKTRETVRSLETMRALYGIFGLPVW